MFTRRYLKSFIDIIGFFQNFHYSGSNYFTNRNLAAIKGDDLPYKSWFQASGEHASVVIKFTQIIIYMYVLNWNFRILYYIYVLPDDVIGIFMGFFSEHIFGEYIFHGFHGFDGGQATSIAGTMVATGLASGNRLVEIYV